MGNEGFEEDAVVMEASVVEEEGEWKRLDRGYDDCFEIELAEGE